MRKAGDILSALFNEKFDPVFLRKAKTTAGLFGSWAAITEEAGIASAASHSRISELEHGILLIETDHPGWRQILQTTQGQLLSTVQRRCPELEIRGIAFRLSRDPLTFLAAAEAAEIPAEIPAAKASEPGPVETPQTRDPVTAGEPAAASFQGDLAGDPAAEEAYNLLKRQLEESIKRRNKNWARGRR
jgi:hypothetical protein